MPMIFGKKRLKPVNISYNFPYTTVQGNSFLKFFLNPDPKHRVIFSIFKKLMIYEDY